ncbi:hypothetical protein [uncultured Salipiger sp.]|uniref:ImuA family protein n=1 Tax=uncultured Salipiger sp. TaxID=499810 RepID=UPI0025928020|nr:hypothetical protein [uncultured Salipiger sp.]
MQPNLHSFPLRPGRVHEVCGPGATSFAAIVAASGAGPVLWVRQDWVTEILNPVGLAAFFDPARLLIAQAPSQSDALAVTEEALRDGSVPLVVTEITRPLDLRQGRRLQLAAGTGGSTGLCLIPEGMGSNAAETRWHASPRLAPDGADSTALRWELIKNKTGTLGAWDVRWDETAHRLHVVSPVGERPGPAQARG